MSGYFFLSPDDERCYTLSALRQLHPNERLQLWTGKPYKLEGYFWCRHYEEMGETGHCGKACEAYAPCNGKSGRCRHFNPTFYEPTPEPRHIQL